MGQKGSREAQEAPRAQDREKSPRAPRQTAGDEWAQTVTNGGARFVPLAATVWAVTEVQELGNDDSTSGGSVSLDADDSAEYDE